MAEETYNLQTENELVDGKPNKRRFRNICFTFNNYTTEDDENSKNAWGLETDYIVVGKEVGEENGTPHLQGYYEFSTQYSFKQLKAAFPRGLIFGRRYTKSNAFSASTYCKKGKQPKHEWLVYKHLGPNFGLDADFFEKGEPKKQGKRNDLNSIRKIADTDGMRGVTANCRSAQQITVAKEYLKYNERARNFETHVIYIFGRPDSGKSRYARELIAERYPEYLNDIYEKDGGEDTKWWEGYDAHKCVIMDDFRDSDYKFISILNLLDRYGKRVQYKGGSRQFLARLVIMTTIHPPERCFKYLRRESKRQFLRRIDEVINYSPEWEPEDDMEPEDDLIFD